MASIIRKIRRLLNRVDIEDHIHDKFTQRAAELGMDADFLGNTEIIAMIAYCRYHHGMEPRDIVEFFNNDNVGTIITRAHEVISELDATKIYTYEQDLPLGIKIACRDNRVDYLEEWMKIGLTFEFSHFNIVMASENGSVDVLQWILTSGYEFCYDPDGIHLHDYPEVIRKWWMDSGLVVRHTGIKSAARIE